MVLGTPSYMSPEQLAGKKIDGRSDLFSLGVMLFQMAVRQAAVRGRVDGPADVQDRQRAASAHPRGESLQVPECLAAIIDRALAKDNAQRYQTGAEMAGDLRACMGLSSGATGASPQVDFNL
jgi:serine/threonine protein kinase